MAQVMFVIASQRTLLNDAIKAQQEKDDTEKGKLEKKNVQELESEMKKLQAQIEHLQKQINEIKM
jgi:peptidoglycan hydrolase CwlO-like protein